MDNQSNSDNLKNALCYLPLVSVVFFFLESNKNPEFMRHIRYWFSIFVVYLVLYTLVWWAIWSILFLVYIWAIGFLGYRAYKWEKIEIEYIDKFESKVRESLNNKKD